MSGGAGNGDPSLCLGGAISTALIGKIQSGRLGNLWDPVPKSEADTGLKEEYRCIFGMNVNPVDSIKQVRLFFETKNSDQDVTISIGLDPAGKNGTPATIANEATTPTGVSFSSPKTYQDGLILGKLKAGEFFPFWVKRGINAGAVPFWADAYVLRIEGFPITQNLTDWGFSSAAIFGCKSSAAKTNVLHMTDRLDDSVPLKLFLAVGDMALTNLPDCWFKMTKRIDKFTRVAFAITETDEAPETRSLLNHYGIPNQYYSFDIQNVHFLVMGTDTAYDVNSAQYTFVKNDLNVASLRGDIDWIVVGFSQPFYSAGGASPPPGKPTTTPFDPAKFRDIYHPMFDQYLVDLVLQGHVENYQRTPPLSYNAASPANPTVTDIATNNYVDPVGEIFLNIGTGGHALDSKTSLMSPPAYILKADNMHYGYVWLSFSLQSSILTGIFYGTDNVSLDAFSITRSDIQV